MSRLPLALSLLALGAIAGTAAADIQYPIDVSGTAGQWCRWHIPTASIYDCGLTWPRPDGHLRQGANPDYAYVLQRTDEPPTTDSEQRHRVCGAPMVALDPPAAADPTSRVGTLTTTCQWPLLPVADRQALVSAKAGERVTAAAEAAGIRSPGDVLVAILALDRRSRSIPLTAAEQRILDAVSDSTAQWILDTLSREAELRAAIAAHPDQWIDLGDTQWPPIVAP